MSLIKLISMKLSKLLERLYKNRHPTLLWGVSEAEALIHLLYITL
jgi:hypothetical protein